MRDDHTFVSLYAPGVSIDTVMRVIEDESERGAGYGFVDGKGMHKDFPTIRWKPGDDWKPRVRAALDRAFKP